MNKKIKLSLLGVLFATSTLAITMPIVSCSGDTSTPSTNNTLTVFKGNNTQLAAIGNAIATVGKSGNTSKDVLTSTEHNNALKATYTGNVKNAIDAYFTFWDDKNNVVDFNPIENIVLTGTYPPATSPNSNLNVRVSIQLNNKYSVVSTNNLNFNVQIGLSTFDLSVTQGNRVQSDNIALAIAKVGNSTTNSTGSPLTSEQYERALTATYTGNVKTAIDNYFTIRSGETTLTDAINRIIVERTSVGALAVQVVNLTIVLKPGYTSSSSLTITNLQIGFGRS